MQQSLKLAFEAAILLSTKQGHFGSWMPFYSVLILYFLFVLTQYCSQLVANYDLQV